MKIRETDPVKDRIRRKCPHCKEELERSFASRTDEKSRTKS